MFLHTKKPLKKKNPQKPFTKNNGHNLTRGTQNAKKGEKATINKWPEGGNIAGDGRKGC